jgi:FMN-dependent NADH-azoreductase
MTPKKVLRVRCSARAAESESLRLSEEILRHLAGREAIEIIEVDATQLAHVDQDYSLALSSPAEPPAEAQASGALQASNRLIALLREADYVLIATPMHNFTVSSALKAWLDHVIRVRLTFDITPRGKIGTLPDRPVFVAIASGGEFSGDAARQPDFLTPYLRHALATIGLQSVEFFSVQGTARGPAHLESMRAFAQAQLRARFAAALPA